MRHELEKRWIRIIKPAFRDVGATAGSGKTFSRGSLERKFLNFSF